MTPHPVLLLPLLLLTLSTPRQPKAPLILSPPPLSVSLSLLLCSRLERSQLLRGLQCYAIAQELERTRKEGEVEEGEDVEGVGGAE